MQNNVTELKDKLLRSLDSNYNVIDMPAVIEIISLLEKVAITKELLETTRLGKYINELRRKTTNDSLSKRAKQLVKKWRNAILPDSNGQIKQNSPVAQEDVNLNQLKVKKRPAKDPPDVTPTKRMRMNGGISELDFSDNSNSSFKDVISSTATARKIEPKNEVILVNSDSNSSISDKIDPLLDQQMPKKRGRKKGSKNHKNLIDEAESSFTSKLAVSRGNSKVKTTKELIADLKNRNSSSGLAPLKPREDLKEKAAKLEERVSIIDQKLNTNTNRNKSFQRSKFKIEKNERVIESGSVINDKSLLAQNSFGELEDDEKSDYGDPEDEISVKDEDLDASLETDRGVKLKETSLSIEDCLSLLPPIDKSVLLETDDEPCFCVLREVEDDDSETAEPRLSSFEFVEDERCCAKFRLMERYKLGSATEESVARLHSEFVPNINGIESVDGFKTEPASLEDGLYANVVAEVNGSCVLPKVFEGENYTRYSFAETRVEGDAVVATDDHRTGGAGDSAARCFREWHEVAEAPSYNGETLRILPYCVID